MEFALSGLSQDTEYDVRASLKSNFSSGVQSGLVVTLGDDDDPRVTGLSVDDANRYFNKATISVSLASIDSDTTVYVRHRHGSQDWANSRTSQLTTASSPATHNITGLQGNRTFHVEASTNSSFALGITEKLEFKTRKVPRIRLTKGLEIRGQSATRITLTVRLRNAFKTIAYLRYRTTPQVGSAGSWQYGQVTVSDSFAEFGSADFDIEGLLPSTRYEIQTSARE